MAKKTQSEIEAEGLMAFIDAQSQVIVTQCDNFARLLGRDSKDHTHTGNLCEHLLREWLRGFLPKRFSIDKGFIFGRSQKSNRHCPEIDLLIHDEQYHSPIYRMQDIVIVQPEAVRGIIQVKKTLSHRRRAAESPSHLERGLANIRNATEFLYEQKNAGEIFCAVIAMSGDLPETGKETFPNTWKASGIDPNLAPHFVGSLQGRFAMPSLTTNKVEVWPSTLRMHNIAMPFFLSRMLARLLANNERPFYYPTDAKSAYSFPLIEVQ
ncbi:DUF6602 domain-containing protein [Anatilimnocola floriformis]|uniref:DUF6602 domain-containing protein n=1 Tax=Anatilimnocola floriformis TaxID=2948575 RepID=UPI0020C2D0FE|nr:DUF6602 domain-containing protein [Anatilimnocola floriformis]